MNTSHLALNSQQASQDEANRLALNFQIPEPEPGKVPQWVLLIPAGEFTGRDKRAWNNSDPQAVIAHTRALGRDIPFDVEHATEIKGPQGEYATAVGWISVKDLEIRDGAIWGKVAWNEGDCWLIKSKSYRYYSPAFTYDSTGKVTSIKSVGLTNAHNLQLPALNSQQQRGTDDMSLPAAIRQALGLNDDANEAQAVQAIGQLKQDHQLALNRAETPDPEKFVPKADLELALNRANSAETALKTVNDEKLEAAIDHAIEVDKKIAPASRDHYLALCREASKPLETFQNLVGTLPAIVGTEGNGGKKPEGGNQPKLTDEQIALCRQTGQSEEEFLSALAEHQA